MKGEEIERKFLVDTAQWKPRDEGELYRQGYLSTHKERTVRVRRQGAKAVLTIKGATHGVTRVELEYPVPLDDADKLLALCEKPLIEKTRHTEDHGGTTWEIDVFHGVNDGLVVAEVELEREDAPFHRPAWVGAEVSDDARYFNANLVAHPFSTWTQKKS